MKGLEQIRADEEALAARRKNTVTDDDLLQAASTVVRSWDWSMLAQDAHATDLAEPMLAMARLEGLFAMAKRQRGGK